MCVVLFVLCVATRDAPDPARNATDSSMQCINSLLRLAQDEFGEARRAVLDLASGLGDARVELVDLQPPVDHRCLPVIAPRVARGLPGRASAPTLAN